MSTNWADRVSQKLLAEAREQEQKTESEAATRDHLRSESPIYWEMLHRELRLNICALNNRLGKRYLDTFLFPAIATHDLMTSSVKGSLRILFNPAIPVVLYEFAKVTDITPEEPPPRISLYFAIDEGRVRLTREDGTPLRPPAMADYLLNMLL